MFDAVTPALFALAGVVLGFLLRSLSAPSVLPFRAALLNKPKPSKPASGRGGKTPKQKASAKNAAAVLNASVDHQKIKTAEIEIPVIAADVLEYGPGELGDSYPEKTRLYYAPDALRDPEYLQTVLRSPLQVKTHEKNTGEGNRGVDGWPVDVRWDEGQQRVIAKGVLHGEDNVAYAEANRNKPSFGTSAFISFLQVDRTPGVTPDGKPYDAVVRKAVNNHVMIGPNVRDPRNVILAMNALGGGEEMEAENSIGDILAQMRAGVKRGDYEIGQIKRFIEKGYFGEDRADASRALEQLMREPAWSEKPGHWKGSNSTETKNETGGRRMAINADDFREAMQAYEQETKKEEELFNRVKNAVLEDMKNAKNTDEKKDDLPKEKKDVENADEKKEEKDEKKEEASNALPSDSMVKDFSDALGVTFTKTPSLKQLAAVAGVTGKDEAEIISALNAKRETLKKPAPVEAVNSAESHNGVKTVDELLRKM